VSYEDKHNELNGEENNDGHDHNYSHNFGVEGPTDDPEVNALRSRMQRNMLATLLLSQGVPMIAHGDEVNRTQHGNNNAYAQDNDLAWMNWDDDPANDEMFRFTQELIALRKQEPLLRRRRYFRGQPDRANTLKDVAWLRVDGSEMTHEDWMNPEGKPLIFRLSGSAFEEADDFGAQIRTSSLLIVMHRGDEPVHITTPEPNGETGHQGWETILTTDSCSGEAKLPTVHEGRNVEIPGRTVVVFRGIQDEDASDAGTVGTGA
jgi:glycogen operon protein